MTPANCDHCGTALPVTGTGRPRRGQRFCRNRCRDRWHQARRREAVDTLRERLRQLTRAVDAIAGPDRDR